MIEFIISYSIITDACLIISLIIFFKFGTDIGSELEIKMFRKFLGWYMMFLATNSVLIWINHGYLNKNIGVVLSYINIISIVLCSMYWFYYSEIKINSGWFEKKLFKFIIRLIVLFIVILVTASIWNHKVFFYNEFGYYVQGPLYIYVVVIGVLAFLFASFHALLCGLRAKSIAVKKECFNIMLFVLCPIIAYEVDIIIPNMPVIESAFMVGIFLMFVNLQEARIYSDALTGLNNRRLADEWLSNKIPDATVENKLYLFLIDVNKFKHINDVYGHIEGDKALKVIAAVLRKVGGEYGGFVARWGGDEFVIIIEEKDFESPKVLIDRLNSHINHERKARGIKYELSLSVGYVACDNSKIRIDNLIKQADIKMYEAKERHKH